MRNERDHSDHPQRDPRGGRDRRARGPLIKVRQDLEETSENLATLAGALNMVEQEHLKPLEPAVKAINAQFDVILSALPGIAAKAKIVAERRPT